MLVQKPHRTFWKNDTVWNREKPKKAANPEDKVWRAFSLYIRTRDCIETMNSLVLGKCCTCNAIITSKGNDAGHFVGRGSAATKYDERNSHLQCVKCNRFQSGNWAQYYDFMIAKHGEAVVRALLADKSKVVRWVRDYEAEAAHWRAKTREIKKKFDLKVQ